MRMVMKLQSMMLDHDASKYLKATWHMGLLKEIRPERTVLQREHIHKHSKFVQ